MRTLRVVCLASLTLPMFTAAATAQERSQSSAAPDAGTHSHESSSASHSQASTSASHSESPAPPSDEMLHATLQVDERFEALLETTCTYEVTIRGSVSPVRDNRNANATTQRLRPDLRVAATVRCPQSTESHIQERRVYSTGVTREELERLVELNGTVHRMQNSGRCLYVPGISFGTAGFVSTQVDYLCPRSTSRVHGGAR
jgi:hypothetical protein